MRLNQAVITWWPVLTALAMLCFAFGSVSDRVSANETKIQTVDLTIRQDHDVLIRTSQRVEDIAQHFKISKTVRGFNENE